jgi:hypothetical protein
MMKSGEPMTGNGMFFRMAGRVRTGAVMGALVVRGWGGSRVRGQDR